MVKDTFKILCADDSVSIRTYLTELLQSWGYAVTACSNGKEAWETYQKDPSFSVFVLDWVMPEMNGLEACKLIRKDEDTRPFISGITQSNTNTEKEGSF